MQRGIISSILLLIGLLAATTRPMGALAQPAVQPSIDLPDPFALAASFGQLPPGRA